MREPAVRQRLSPHKRSYKIIKRAGPFGGYTLFVLLYASSMLADCQIYATYGVDIKELTVKCRRKNRQM
jgi:hypothetical protein